MNILDLSFEELKKEIVRAGYKKFRAEQIFNWIYRKHTLSFQKMTNISLKAREELCEKFEIRTLPKPEIYKSPDGTQKLRFNTFDDSAVETVIIPEKNRNTICVSTQIGCPLGCLFCRTGYLGFKRNLETSEITGQILQAEKILKKENRRVTNIVYMGMGEPLLNFEKTVRSIKILKDDRGFNFSNRRITVSTVGISEKITELGKLTEVNLALSLHAVDNKTRSRIMPINRKNPIEPILEEVKRYPMHSRKKLLIEYIMLKDINDSENSAKALASIAHKINAKVNLIPFNSFRESRLKASSQKKIFDFQKILVDRHVTALIRKSRGEEHLAACGQLGHKK
ncbi:MAG: 23S rRNA (adenine(2503)-C(2))-methyltransferase RlmN [bacterium]